jgi:beta-mannosidase
VPTAPGAASSPRDLEALGLSWKPAPVPGTAAQAERDAGVWTFESKRNFDATDWWYKSEFAAAPSRPGSRKFLVFAGLASIADAWLNGTLLFSSENMFLAHEVDVTDLVRDTNELVLRFRSLDAHLKAKKPRPRWRTRLVEQQNLRWCRTTLLGRMPAFTPKVVPVGPFLPISLEERDGFSVTEANVLARLSGDNGAVTVSISLELFGERRVEGATLVVGEATALLRCDSSLSGQCVMKGELELSHIARWWPHTHGAQPLLPAKVTVQLDSGEVEILLGRIAFRSVELLSDNGDFSLCINGESIFCRGACWTTTDIVTLGGSEASYRAYLEQARDAGMNMLRVAGTNFYETDLFYDLCDELGILVWQDFMFANMDYPEDEAFVASVRAEIAQFLSRTQLAPSLAVLCGSSEVEQQVAMLGLPRDLWNIPLFRKHIPEICARLRPDLPYWPSSPSGGDLPFHPNGGAAHYYGVGAYLRPLEDARRAEVRFASECLAFANVPEERTIEAFIGGGVMTPQHAKWKERAPRDTGGSWDFDDVRDHYLERLFGTNARDLRSTDIDRYLALSRVVSGEVMAAVFGEWRRHRSTCHGGLVFTYQDLWPSPGFGVIDSLGRPKAAYYYLKRAFAPVALFISDEGNNGLFLHAPNETPVPLSAELRITLYRQAQVVVATKTIDWPLPPRSTAERGVDGLFEHFLDTSYSYRFGPPGHDLVTATLTDKSTQTQLAQAFHFPLGPNFPRESDLGLEAKAERLSESLHALTIRTNQFAQSINIEAGDTLPDDNFFHLEPGSTRTLMLRSRQSAPLTGTLHPLNAQAPTRIVT